MKTISNFFYGILVGGILGGVIGLLLAPGKGSETRAAINQKFEGVSEQVKQAVEQRRHELEKEIQDFSTF